MWKLTGQDRQGRGEARFSSGTSHSESEEPGQDTSVREQHLALGLATLISCGGMLLQWEIVWWEEKCV